MFTELIGHLHMQFTVHFGPIFANEQVKGAISLLSVTLAYNLQSGQCKIA